MAVLKQIKVGESISKIQFTEVKPASDGVITAIPSHTDSADENNPEYAIDLTIANDGTLVKENKALKVGTVPAAQVSVAEGTGLKASDAQTAFKELKDGINAVGGAAKSYTIVKNTEGLATNIKEQYKLQETVGKESNFVGAPIDIYKDSSLKSVALDGQTLNFTYILADGSESIVGVNVSTFLAESEFANGLQVTDHVVSVKIDQDSEKDSQAEPAAFLTVSANGIKISGIKDEIDRKIAALDVDDAAATGQYVSSVSETNGKIAVSRLNVSDAVLNGYAKGTDATAILATDSLKVALGKLENQVDNAKAAATTKVVKGADDGNNLSIDTTNNTDGSVTYTVNLTDVASKAALNAEIAARKAVDGQTGDTYAKNGDTNYISDASSLNDADVKLDVALKAEETRAQKAEKEIADKVGLTGDEGARTYANTGEYIGKETSNTVASDIKALDTQLKNVTDKLSAVQYQVSGTTLEFFGISPKTV